jgi:glutamine amidotransferase
VIYILDYGAGNLKSAYHAFQSYTEKSVIIENVSQIKSDITGIVLPGDGSFPYAFNNLKKRGFVSFIKDHRELPLLGICVGYQLLFSSSSEDGGSEGLDLIKGKVEHFPSSPLKIPHMGWNDITLNTDTPVTKGIKTGDYFYFVHSYYPVGVDKSNVLMSCDYIVPFCAAVNSDNVYGFQFHPEKSHDQGRRIIKNFVDLCQVGN